MEKSTIRMLTKKSMKNQQKQIIFHQNQGRPDKKQILNGHAIEKYFQRIQKLDYTLSCILILQIVLLYCYYELDLNKINTAKWFLRGGEICGVLGFSVIIARHIHYKKQQEFIGEQPQGQGDLILRISLFLIMPFELSDDVYMNLTHVDDSSDIEIRVQYTEKLNHLLIILTFLRMCFFASTVLIRSRYLSPRSIRISTLIGFYPGMIYCIKSMFKDYPFTFVVGIYAFSFTMFTIAFRITENVIYNNTPSDTYTNMAWMTIITMTTVGYGDYSPKTNLGRLIGLFCISSGVLIVAIMVVVLTRTFSMDINQIQTLYILRKLEANSELREAAGEYLRESVWRRWQNKKLKQNCLENLNERKLLIRFKKVKDFCQSKKTAQADVDYFKEMQGSFQRAFNNLESLKETNRLIIKHINDEFVVRKQKGVVVLEEFQ